MSGWNYRLVKSIEGVGENQYMVLGVHEVYYNDKGDIVGHVEQPTLVASQFVDEDNAQMDCLLSIKDQIDTLLKASSHPVIDKDTLCG